MGSFTYVKVDGNETIIPPTLSMKIIYYDVGCGKDESNLFPCEQQNVIAIHNYI